MSWSDDEPTKQVPPARPRKPSAPSPAAPPGQHARTWEEELADRIDSLRNWLVLFGIVSVAAFGVAIYALVLANEDEGPSSSGATSSQVRDAIAPIKSDISKLQDDVQKLQSEQSDGGSGQDPGSLQQQIEDLIKKVQDLQGEPAP